MFSSYTGPMLHTIFYFELTETTRAALVDIDRATYGVEGKQSSHVVVRCAWFVCPDWLHPSLTYEACGEAAPPGHGDWKTDHGRMVLLGVAGHSGHLYCA